MVLWHRLRGHRVTRYRRNVDMTVRGGYGIAMEQGRTDRGQVCSCGQRWPEGGN